MQDCGDCPKLDGNPHDNAWNTVLMDGETVDFNGDCFCMDNAIPEA